MSTGAVSMVHWFADELGVLVSVVSSHAQRKGASPTAKIVSCCAVGLYGILSRHARQG